MGVKINTKLIGYIMWTIFPLNWIEPILFFLKWENMLVLKYEDPSILQFLIHTYRTAVLSGLRIVALFYRIVILQNKAVRIINFQPSNSHTSPLFKQNSILKFQEKISLENILFVSKSLNNLSPSVFNTWLVFSSDQHSYETSSSTQGILIKLFYKTNRYGKFSITISAAESRNKLQKQLKNTLLKDLYPNKIKTGVSNFYLKSY